MSNTLTGILLLLGSSTVCSCDKLVDCMPQLIKNERFHDSDTVTDQVNETHFSKSANDTATDEIKESPSSKSDQGRCSSSQDLGKSASVESELAFCVSEKEEFKQMLDNFSKETKEGIKVTIDNFIEEIANNRTSESPAKSELINESSQSKLDQTNCIASFKKIDSHRDVANNSAEENNYNAPHNREQTDYNSSESPGIGDCKLFTNINHNNCKDIGNESNGHCDVPQKRASDEELLQEVNNHPNPELLD